MSSKLVLLLLLGLTLKEGETSSIGSSDSEVLEKIKNSASNQIVCPSNTSTDSPLNLTAIIRFIVKDDVERYQSVLYMARNAPTSEMKNEIIKAVAVDFESSNVDPIVILDFYKQIRFVDMDLDIWSKEIYQIFVNRSARILADSIHSNKSQNEFPAVSKLLIRLRDCPDLYNEDILEALFDIVLSSESPLNVAQRLYDLDTDLTQITIANMLLLNRTEVKTNSSEHSGLQGNLQKLTAIRGFKYVPVHLRSKVYRMFPHFFDWLSTARFACLRQAYHNSVILSQCYYADTLTLCTQTEHESHFLIFYDVDEKGSRIALRNLDSYGYFAIDPAIQVQRTREKVSRTICNDGTSFLWRVVPVPNSGVALYDDETSRSVLCGNNTLNWYISMDNSAYTRPAEDFEAHREECIWFFDDCSYE